MKILYLDCFSGISGDMCLGALIDAGADEKRLRKDLLKLPLYDWDMRIEKKNSRGITGTKVDIAVREDHQPHRNFSDIEGILKDCSLPDKARDIALRIFERLAGAEGKVHGLPAGRVHFHEVGGVDSIVDIVGTSLALYYLEVDRVICSPVPPGRGTVNCRHGVLPVPAPATAELLKGIPLARLNVEGELVTPTGAAIAATVAQDFGPLPEMKVEALGYGFGSKDFGIPNFLRVFIGESTAGVNSYNTEAVMVMETNIDDMNPEFLGHIMDRLFACGALDAFISPAYMKKNRPGYLLTVLCPPPLKDTVLKVLFEETSTLGVRWRQEQKSMLGRRVGEVDTPYGTVRVKYALSGDGKVLRAAPEYEDCKSIAREKGVPLREIYEAALLKSKEGGY
ncbi:MAG: nickel pincer cofactor biosynthesis protein LarC [Actinobacteria bacterium]|nr:nickel pincer cofactor biosynthesis protein LarC [Actinomycetota bacterium]